MHRRLLSESKETFNVHFSLTPQEVDDMTGRLPKLKHNSDNFFRSLGSQGLISYRSNVQLQFTNYIQPINKLINHAASTSSC